MWKTSWIDLEKRSGSISGDRTAPIAKSRSQYISARIPGTAKIRYIVNAWINKRNQPAHKLPNTS